MILMAPRIPTNSRGPYEVRDRRPATKYEWMDEGACAGVPGGGALFFPSEVDHATIREAKAVCATCIHKAKCADYALTRREEHGIWGGLSEKNHRIQVLRQYDLAVAW